jgi:hypothetical protein
MPSANVLDVTNMSFVPSVVVLIVVMLSVIMLNVVLPRGARKLPGEIL